MLRDDYRAGRLFTLMMIKHLQDPALYASLPEEHRKEVFLKVMQQQRRKLAELRHVYYRGRNGEL